jgi:hypothetical protein
MVMYESVREAKLVMLAEAVADAQAMKAEVGVDVSVDDIRRMESDTIREILEAGGSVAAVEAVPLPSERV